MQTRLIRKSAVFFSYSKLGETGEEPKIIAKKSSGHSAKKRKVPFKWEEYFPERASQKQQQQQQKKKKKKKAKKQKKQLPAPVPAPAPAPSRTSPKVLQYYLDVTSALFTAITPKAAKVNHHTKIIIGFPLWAYEAVFSSFSELSLGSKGRSRVERIQRSNNESSREESLAHVPNSVGSRVRERDATRSEQHGEDVANWCAFQHHSRGNPGGRRYKFGWGNFIWFNCGTLVVVTRVQGYWYTGKSDSRPRLKIYFDTITYSRSVKAAALDTTACVPGLSFQQGYYTTRYVTRLHNAIIPQRWDDARADGMPFSYEHADDADDADDAVVDAAVADDAVADDVVPEHRSKLRRLLAADDASVSSGTISVFSGTTRSRTDDAAGTRIDTVKSDEGSPTFTTIVGGNRYIIDRITGSVLSHCTEPSAARVPYTAPYKLDLVEHTIRRSTDHLAQREANIKAILGEEKHWKNDPVCN